MHVVFFTDTSNTFSYGTGKVKSSIVLQSHNKIPNNTRSTNKYKNLHLQPATKTIIARPIYRVGDVIGWYQPIADIPVSTYMFSDMHWY